MAANPAMSSSAEMFLREAVARAMNERGGESAWSRRPGASVALAVRDDVRPTDQPFVEHVLGGLGPVVQAAGLRCLSLYGHTDDIYWTLADHIDRWRLVGMVMVSLHEGDPLPSLLAGAGFPAVTIGRTPVADIPWVDADNRGGSRAAVEHLLRQGYRRPATITGPLNQQAMVDRLWGYRDALVQAEIDPGSEIVVEGDGTLESGRHLMARLVEEHPELDAVFFASEIMARGAMQTWDVVGGPGVGSGGVPLGLVTFDDGEFTRARGMTAVAQPVVGMGRAAGEMLVELMDGGSAVNREVATSLVVRASSSAPAAQRM